MKKYKDFVGNLSEELSHEDKRQLHRSARDKLNSAGYLVTNDGGVQAFPEYCVFTNSKNVKGNDIRISITVRYDSGSFIVKTGESIGYWSNRFYEPRSHSVLESKSASNVDDALQTAQQYETKYWKVK